ncbi:MAG: hypothetical protein WAK48_15525 [Candidatus Acidiferrum sp.]
MLTAMYENRALVGNACANTVCSLDLLRPNSTHPDTPAFELFGSCLLATMMNCNAVPVAQQNNVGLLAHDRVKPVYLVLGLDEKFVQGFARDA